MRSIGELTELIGIWHFDRKITINGNSATQTIKLGEEFGELCAGIARGDIAEIKDALGDMYVVMVAVARLEGLELEQCIDSAYDEIKDRKGYLTTDGVFIKES